MGLVESIREDGGKWKRFYDEMENYPAYCFAKDLYVRFCHNEPDKILPEPLISFFAD